MNASSKSFRDLVVWQEAHEFTLAVYRSSAGFPPDERFGLVSQIRRAAAGIPANIAEGFRRQSAAEKARFYNIAQSSADESLYHLILAHDLGYADTTALQKQVEDVNRLLSGYISGLLRRS